jgi:hypothetical protein
MPGPGEEVLPPDIVVEAIEEGDETDCAHVTFKVTYIQGTLSGHDPEEIAVTVVDGISLDRRDLQVVLRPGEDTAAVADFGPPDQPGAVNLARNYVVAARMVDGEKNFENNIVTSIGLCPG